MLGVGVVSFLGIGIGVFVHVGGNQTIVGVFVAVVVAVIEVGLGRTSARLSTGKQADDIRDIRIKREINRRIGYSFFTSIPISLLWKHRKEMGKYMRGFDE